MRRILVLVAIFAGVAQPVRGQWVVYDAAVTGRNTVTASVAELALAIQREQHERIRRMAARLSAVTDLRTLAASNPPEWFGARPTGSALSQAVELAMHGIGESGRAYDDVIQSLGDPTSWDGLLSDSRRKAVAARLATIQTADAMTADAIGRIGRLRMTGAEREQSAIDALAREVLNGSDAQSATAALEKTLGATLIGTRQRQARIGLLSDLVEQLLVDSKRTRDTTASALNMQIETWRSADAANRALMAGTGDALNSWRQP